MSRAHNTLKRLLDAFGSPPSVNHQETRVNGRRHIQQVNWCRDVVNMCAAKQEGVRMRYQVQVSWNSIKITSNPSVNT